jgi:hypothetical protein
MALLKIDKTKLKKFDNEIYVSEEDVHGLTDKKQKMFPIYFAITRVTRIHHDTPAIGAYEYGETDKSVSGPFLTQEEAALKIKMVKDAVPYSQNEFSSEIKALFVTAEQTEDISKIPLFKYCERRTKISLTHYAFQYIKHKEWEQYIDKVKQCFLANADESRENEKEHSLEAMIKGVYVRMGRHFEGIYFSTFGLADSRFLNMPEPYSIAGWGGFAGTTERGYTQYVSLSEVRITLDKHNAEGMI